MQRNCEVRLKTPPFSPSVPRHSSLYPLFLVVLFVVSTITAYTAIQPINHLDWVTTSQFLRYMTRFQDPYDETLSMDSDLLVYDVEYESLPYAPWAVFYFGPIAYFSTRLILALSIAAFVIVMVDFGKPFALMLILHPTFWMLLASGNTDFLVNGVGLWLIFRGARGWQMGVVIMLLAIKPQVLPFLIVLECVRILWERDWKTALTMALIFGISVALFPRWLDWPLDILSSYFDVIRGVKTGNDVKFGGGYPFSVFGAWGVLPALAVTAAILLLMRRRLTEWRTLAVLLSFVWTTYVNPYSYSVLLILFRKTPVWRTALYLVLSLATLPFLFVEWHRYERYGVLAFLLLAAWLTTPMPDQTEEAIARQRHVPVFPPVRWLLARRSSHKPAPR